MGFDQKGGAVFRIARGKNDKWVVNEEGFDKALASFDTEKDALNYANDIARTKQGSKVILEDSALS